MHGKLFKEWVSFLKERKLYSNFILNYITANRNCRTWERQKPSLKLINGDDFIMPNKSDSLSFEAFLDKLALIDWSCSYYYGYYWTNIGREFGELKGYLQKRDAKQSSATIYSPIPNPNHRHRRRKENEWKEDKEEYIKWYDRYNARTMRNRYAIYNLRRR